MRIFFCIDQTQVIEWGLTIPEAVVFDFIHNVPGWAESKSVKGQTWFFLTKEKIIQELPMLTDKIDTVYRYLKTLEDKDLIECKQEGGKSWIRLTERARTWNNFPDEIPTPRKAQKPDTLPKKTGQVSEKNRTGVRHTISILKDKSKDNNTGDNVIFGIEEKEETKFEEPVPIEQPVPVEELIPEPVQTNGLDKKKEHIKTAPKPTLTIEQKQKEFFQMIIDFIKDHPNHYPKQFYLDFTLHWAAQSKDHKTLLHWETLKTFWLSGRLAKWWNNLPATQREEKWNKENSLPIINSLFKNLL